MRQTYYGGLPSTKEKYKRMEIWLGAIEKITKSYAMHTAKVYFAVTPCLGFQHSQIFETRHGGADSFP